MAWQEGQLIQERKYEIKRKLGQGGYGTVYLARDDHKARDVAIKTLHEHLRENEDYERFEQDFMNEARRLAGFSHLPFIVSIYEVIKEEDIWGIVMEYIDGKNLDHLGIIPEELALLYIQQSSSALSEVHEKGLLHRDIKPSNILVRNETNEAILVDFGIAREFTAKIIQTQTPLYSPFYASPEQYNPRTERSASSDVYSLAATLYKTLAGKEPESAPSRMCGCELKSPKQLNPTISDAVESGILKGLELQANKRPQSIKEWLEIMEVKLITPSEYKISQNTINLKNTEESITELEERKRIEGRVKFYISELSSPEPSSRHRAIQELGLLGESASSSVPLILDQQRKRFTVLKFIWQETKTQSKDSLSYSTAKDIAIKTGIDDDDLFGIFQYLESEGLIELLQYMGQLPLSRITHRGKIEIENAIIKPTEDTEHFTEDTEHFILDQQRKRLTVLKFIWQETKTQPKDSLSYSTAKDIATKTGIDDDDLFGIFQYLESEGLIELLQYMGQLPLSRITHRGKIEIENAIIKPTEDTEHFLSSVIVNIATMNQTNINAGRDAYGNVIDSQINAPITNTISNIQQ